MKKALLAAFSNPFNWKAFIILAILLRGVVWIYMGHLASVNVPASNRIEKYFVGDDYGYFFAPVDNYFNTGHYSYLPGKPFTGRMPGYAIVYFLFRLVFSQPVSVILVISLQLLLSCISVYILSLTAYYIFNNSNRCFYLTYSLYVLAAFPGFFDFFIIAESLSVSSLIFSLFYLTKYLKVEAKSKYLMLSGLFLTWTIFLREYTALLIILFPLAIAYFLYFIKREHALLAIAKKLLLFCLPFIICELAWVGRNYTVTKQIIFTESSIDEAYGNLYSRSWQALDNLVFTWGENASPFDKTSLGYYYRNPRELVIPTFHESIFHGVTTYNKDSLIKLHSLYNACYYNTDTLARRKLDELIVNKCELYKQDYISHNFFKYWFIKPIKDLKYFVIFSGSGYLPMPAFSASSLLEKLIKLLFSLLYYTILITGLIGLLWSCVISEKDKVFSWLILAVALTITFSIIFYSEIQEPRYFVHVFALLFLYAGFTFNKILSKWI